MIRSGNIFRQCCLSAALAFVCAAHCVIPAHAEELSPRAQAVETMQRFAGALDRGYAVISPFLNAGLSKPIRFSVEHDLALADTALTAYALADAHDAVAQRLALEFGDTLSAAKAIVARAENALTIGDYAQCANLAQQLANLAQDSASKRLRMQSEVFRGVLARRHGNLDEAIEHQRNALELASALDDKSTRARTLAHLGTIYRDRGDFAQALDYQTQALVIAEKIDDRTELVYRNLALLYNELGDDTTSKGYFEKAIAAAIRHGDPSRYASAYGSYSNLLNDTGDYSRALDAARETLSLDLVLNDRPATAFEELESGRALFGLKRFDEARASLESALAEGRLLKQHEIVARSQLALAELALARGDRVRAATLLDEALRRLNTTRLKPQLAHAYALRDQLASAQGDAATALVYAHKYGALREELLGTAASRRLAALAVRHARADAEQKLVLANEENALQAARIQQQRLQRRFGIAIIGGLVLLLAVVIWRWLDMGRLNRALNTRNVQIEEQRRALTDANMRLERQSDELYHAAITDSLTGTFNRGYLLRDLDRRIANCVREGRELALLMIDFDHFKRINDTRGHVFGDRVLVAGVQTIRQWLEPGAIFGRFGGEEFLIVVQDQDATSVSALAERLRVHVADDLTKFVAESRTRATISIGIAMLSQLQKPPRLEELIDAADRAVYAAKTAGRDRVMLYAA
ncbi:MAG: tetratricopeptide repeat-containing diguanylate cyclase [Rudaea sp.]